MPINLKTVLSVSSIILLFLAAIYFIPTKNLTFLNPNNAETVFSTSTEKNNNSTTTESEEKDSQEENYFELPINFEIAHLETPEIVKGIYITENTFADTSKMNEIFNLLSSTQINSAVIDINSDGGPLFLINESIAKARLSLMHSKGIYLIARVVALNDENGGWYDPLSEERRKELVNISARAINSGFDEINFDYIRYPGPSEPQIFDVPLSERIKNVTSLFKFLKENIRDKFNRPISMDIFGSTFIYPESNIGQSVEEAVKYFDYVMPMPYPSHWADWTFGFKKPGEYPYEVVKQSLEIGWSKVKNMSDKIAKLRVWIQDFNLKSITPITYLEYTPEMIHQQIYACYCVGCSGWVLWNPSNDYSEDYMNVPPSADKYPASPLENSTNTLKTSTDTMSSTSTNQASTTTQLQGTE